MTRMQLRQAQTAPSPLAGEGWGEGHSRIRYLSPPSSLSLPLKGEGNAAAWLFAKPILRLCVQSLNVVRGNIERLQRAIPIRKIHIRRPYFDAVFLRVAHDLRRGVKPHRLTIEQRCRKHVRIAALHPSRGIDQVSEARRMAFGKAVAAESLDLFPTSHGEFRVVTAA